MEMNFCRRCGAALDKKSNTAYVCANGHEIYANPEPGANVFFVTGENKVLLLVRAFEPYKGMLDAVGGFIDFGETAEQALTREIKEETGILENQYTAPVYMGTQSVPYPYDNEVRSPMPLFFWSRLASGVEPKASDDAESLVEVDLYNTDDETLERIKPRTQFLKLRSLLSEESS